VTTVELLIMHGHAVPRTQGHVVHHLQSSATVVCSHRSAEAVAALQCSSHLIMQLGFLGRLVPAALCVTDKTSCMYCLQEVVARNTGNGTL
jgi:hypothetical protein